MSNRKQANRAEGIVRAVGALITVGVALLLASCTNARNTSGTADSNVCISNLRQIENAIQTWALENHPDASHLLTFKDIDPYLAHPLHCPDGGIYILMGVGKPPRCSIGGTHVLPADTSDAR